MTARTRLAPLFRVRVFTPSFSRVSFQDYLFLAGLDRAPRKVLTQTKGYFTLCQVEASSEATRILNGSV